MLFRQQHLLPFVLTRYLTCMLFSSPARTQLRILLFGCRMCRVAAVTNCVCVCQLASSTYRKLVKLRWHVCVPLCCISTIHPAFSATWRSKATLHATAVFKIPSCSVSFFNFFYFHALPLSLSEPGANRSVTSRWYTLCVKVLMGTSLMTWARTPALQASGIKKTNTSVALLPRTVKLSGKM